LTPQIASCLLGCCPTVQRRSTSCTERLRSSNGSLAEFFGDPSILYRGIVTLHICLSLLQTCLPTLCIQPLNFISTITSVRRTRSWCTTPGLGDSITVSSFGIDQNTHIDMIEVRCHGTPYEVCTLSFSACALLINHSTSRSAVNTASPPVPRSMAA
jgi:hypothetical protein